MTTEVNNTINYLDMLIRRNIINITIELYRKPTETGTVIHFRSNHPYEHKIAAFLYYINRITTMPITENSKQNEWETVIKKKKNNDFPISILTDLKTKMIKRKKQKQDQIQQQQEITTQRCKWVTFTYHSPLIRRITNLFKQTNVKIAFCATNTIQQLNTAKHTHNDPSGIYKLKCNTCNKVYVGQSGRAIGIRLKEHIQYIKSNNSTPAYAARIRKHSNMFRSPMRSSSRIFYLFPC
jgi:site-specific DNA-adenine methylase